MSEVTKLGPTRVVLLKEAEVDVVSHIEKLLERAKSGEIRAIGYAIVMTDGLTCDGGGTSCGYRAPANTHFALTHAIQRLVKLWEAIEL